MVEHSSGRTDLDAGGVPDITPAAPWRIGMDDRRDRATRVDRAGRRAASGSKPKWKIFLPFIVLGVVLAAAFVWIYFLGPQGAHREPMMHDDAGSGPEASARVEHLRVTGTD
jgi:hypothetical protein